jgi:L-ascorbate 6-phosphate lactonase
MIEPVRSGPELAREIEEAEIAPGRLRFWWLGQSGYVIKSSSGTLGVDLYLSEHLTAKYAATERPHVRMTRAPLRGGDLQRIDAVLASHRHSDHLDPGTLPDLLAVSPAAVLVIPESIWEYAVGLGLPADRMRTIDAGKTIEISGFRVTALPSAHEDLETDAKGRQRFLGFLIECEGLRLYHSGDSCVYPGLQERLAGERLDVMFLPINGRNPERGVPGNMTAAEAVDLASAVKPRFVVPHHYDMFTFNTVPIESFTHEARRLPAAVEARVLQCGEAWEIML